MSLELVERIKSLTQFMENEVANAAPLPADSDELKAKQYRIYQAYQAELELRRQIDAYMLVLQVKLDNPPSPVAHPSSMQASTQGSGSSNNAEGGNQSSTAGPAGAGGSQPNEDQQTQQEEPNEDQQTQQEEPNEDQRMQQDDAEDGDTPIHKLPAPARVAAIVGSIDVIKGTVRGILRKAVRQKLGRRTPEEISRAFADLFKIYPDVSEEQVNAQLNKFHVEQTKFEGMFRILTKAQRASTDVKKMMQLEKAEGDISEGSQLLAYTVSIISLIGQLQFAQEWNAKKGGSDWKKDFKEKAWEVHSQQSGQTTADAKVKAAFMIQHKNLVRARNKVLRLYKTMGAVVVLDAIFRPRFDFKGTVLSPAFMKIIEQVIGQHRSLLKSTRLVDRFRDEHPDFEGNDDEAVEAWVRKSHEAASNIVVKILKRIAGDPLSNWAKAFFDDF